MKTLKIIFVILVTLAVVASTAFFLIGYLKPKPGGVMINSSPVASVYINGNLVGKTPYTGTYGAGQLSLRLVPDISDQNLVPYETKVSIDPGIQTVVRREFGTTEDESSQDIVSFAKTGGNYAGLVVISTPDNSQVLIDGLAQGFSPYNASSISPGSHQITIKATDYTDRTLNIKAEIGYRLTLFVKLAKAKTITPTPEPSASQSATVKGFVLIGNTPTGFLRMRTEPATKGEEIAELKTGTKYPYLETDTGSGWFKIQYQEPAPGLPNGITGWVSNQYSSLATQSAIPALK